MGISQSNVFFSKIQQRLLALFYGHPENSYHTNEIIRLLSGSGTGAVQRELKKLADAEIIKKIAIGNQKHYSANQDLPYYLELRSIIFKTFGLADMIAHAIKPVASKIQIAFIYGSIAKQQDNATSDIDLMIISEELSYVDVFSLVENTEKELGRHINPSCYSPAEWTRKLKASNHFLEQIKESPKIFLLGNVDELSKLG